MAGPAPAAPLEIVKTVLKIGLLCLAVGLVLAALGIDNPLKLWGRLIHLIEDVFENFGDWVMWAWPYVVMGAVIVVPIYVVRAVLKIGRGRGGA